MKFYSFLCIASICLASSSQPPWAIKRQNIFGLRYQAALKLKDTMSTMKKTLEKNAEEFLKFSDVANDQIDDLEQLCFAKDYMRLVKDLTCAELPVLRAQIKDLRLQYAPLALSQAKRLNRGSDNLVKALVAAKKHVIFFVKSYFAKIQSMESRASQLESYASKLIDSSKRILYLTDLHQKKVTGYARQFLSYMFSLGDDSSSLEKANIGLRRNLMALVIERDELEQQLLNIEELLYQ